MEADGYLSARVAGVEVPAGGAAALELTLGEGATLPILAQTIGIASGSFR